MFGRRVAYQQGDVIFEKRGRFSFVPRGFKRNKRQDGKIIIAEGEKNGHLHAIATNTVKSFSENGLIEDVEKFLNVEKETTVTHPEHDDIVLPRGKYDVRRVLIVKHDLNDLQRRSRPFVLPE